MQGLEKVYEANQRFIRDIFHLNYFKTADYFERKSEIMHRLKISHELKAVFHYLLHAVSYSFENGKYKFEFKKEDGFLGVQQSLLPFLASKQFPKKIMHACPEEKNVV